jgi:alanyl-tRNA synthetase
MTERIYYTDPACRSFEAVVVNAFERDGRPAIVLDRTAFYPTSGGQPFDTGRLCRRDEAGSILANVVDTLDEGEDVVHLVSQPIEPGAHVRGEIDWARRLDHMQQHTGQHVLSAAFDRMFENRTVSFHLGAEVSTIDLAGELSAADVERAVDEANAIVWEDRLVSIRFASEGDASALALRKEPVRKGPLRLIEVDGFDLSACGGTHVPRTGAIGLIAVLSTERFKRGLRVTFACGQRALRALRLYRDAVTGSIRLLSVLPAELPAAVERLQHDAKELRRALARFQESLAAHEAARLLSAAPAADGAHVVVEALEGWDAQGLKAIASSLTATPGVAAVLFSRSSPAFAVVARSGPLDSPSATSSGNVFDAGRLLRQLLERFGGRGGGKPDLAQGGGLTGDVEEMLAAARELISRSRA